MNNFWILVEHIQTNRSNWHNV